MKSGQARFVTISPYSLLSGTDAVSAGDAAKEIERTLKRAAQAGATGVAWQAAACGKALYQTKVATALSGDRRLRGRRLEAMLNEIDFLEAAIAAARAERLEFAVVSRPFDDYLPGLGSEFERRHQQFLWESRDGEIRLRGVLCLAYDEVLKYRLEIIEELARYGADAVVVDLETSAACMTPFRRRDFFGFNAPIGDEHARRFGEDIRAFDDVEYRRGSDLQIVDAVYRGGEFNREGWHGIKGEYFARFFEQASGIVKAAGKRFAFSRGREEGILPMARFAVPADRWLADGVVDDLFLPRGAGEDRDIAAYAAAKKPSQRIITPRGWDEIDGWIASLRDVLHMPATPDANA